MRAWLFFLFSLCACGGADNQPFVKITLNNPKGAAAPTADTLLVSLSSFVNGNSLQKTIEIPTGGQALPASFVILFSEEIAGNVVDFNVTGLADGVDVFSAKTSAAVGSAEVEAAASFCGDQATDPDRQEAFVRRAQIDPVSSTG